MESIRLSQAEWWLYPIGRVDFSSVFTLVAVGSAATREEKRNERLAGEKRLWFMAAITILIIICCPMAAPSCTSHEKERERIGRWYPACLPADRRYTTCCALEKRSGRDPRPGPLLFDCFDRFDTLWYFRKGKYGFGTGKLPRKEKNCAAGLRVRRGACHLVTINDFTLRHDARSLPMIMRTSFFFTLIVRSRSIYFEEIFSNIPRIFFNMNLKMKFRNFGEFWVFVKIRKIKSKESSKSKIEIQRVMRKEKLESWQSWGGIISRKLS